MPEASSISKFFRAAASGNTDITNTLKENFTDPPSLAGAYPDQYVRLQKVNALKSDSPDWTDKPDGLRLWVRDRLVDMNVSDPAIPDPGVLLNRIIAHIENWPNNLASQDRIGKEQLRQVLVLAINQTEKPIHPVIFDWKLVRKGPVEDNIKITHEDGSSLDLAKPIFDQLSDAGESLLVTFVTHWDRVVDESLSTPPEIKVDVGPEGP